MRVFILYKKFQLRETLGGGVIKSFETSELGSKISYMVFLHDYLSVYNMYVKDTHFR